MKIEEIAEVNPRLDKKDIPDDLLVSFVPMPAVGAGDGSIDVLAVKPFSEVKKGFTSFQQGDVLFAKITPCMENGKMAVVPEVKNGYGFGSTEFHVLRPKPGVNARYLYFYVSSNKFRGDAEHQMTGAVGQKRVPTQFLRDATIPLAPLNEQTRIVAEIEKQFSRLDEAVANLKRVKANLKRYKAAVLKAAVEGKLTEEWRKQHPDVEPADKLLERILEERRANWQGRGKYKEPVAPDTSGLPELPEGWVCVSIGDVFEVCVGATPSRVKPEYWNGSVPWVSSGEVAFCRIRSTRETITDLGLKSSSTKLHPPGTILLGMIGEGKTRGQVAILDIEACNNQNSAAIRVSDTEIVSEYIYSFLEQEYERTRLRGSGGNQPALNKSRVEQIPFSLPPIEEQHQIVAEVERRLSIVADAEAQVDANLRRAARLRQSILKQAFSGQLVSQDPNDEPASVLLGRIRSQQPPQTKEPAARQRKHRLPAPRTGAPRTGAPATNPLPMVAEAPAPYGDAIIARILATMQHGREYARADLVDPLGLTAGQWNTAIQELKRVGKVRQVGERRGARYVVSG
ncbi:restriction endonuclease subunit S [Desulfuromonas sp. TF]|uniref:restriction endonuclease subunit S n=1 Tax=Desulfuromonas sp. TF TaxID=1232410 RepID=UPI00138ACC37|nr:restriction endonuclease subunit S [Desulfuromonas sp. TF]